MKLFVWYPEELTGSYHSGGAAVALAETAEQARELLLPLIKKEGGKSTLSDEDGLVVYDEKIGLIFPNEGCC